jgi:adenylate cyclase
VLFLRAAKKSESMSESDTAFAAAIPPVLAETRRLAVVVFCDVVGWSKLVAQSDSDALHDWSELRTCLLVPLCERFCGRIVEIAGDALIVEFSSVVYAANWAVEVQRRSAAARGEAKGLLSLRIGIAVDDVLVDGEKIVGDGVNIAARIQQLGEADEILVTSAVVDLLHNKTRFVFDDRGEQTLKNIDRPIRLFQILGTEERSRIRRRPHLAWNSRPGIAVLPFRERGMDSDSSFFGEGITDEIITRLSKSRSLYVISRASTARYSALIVETKAVAEELGVRYLLTGTVQRTNDQLRIYAELTDAQLDRLVWSERFQGKSSEIFEIQASIATGIVAAIEPSVERVEAMRAVAKPTHSLSAYEYLLRGQASLYSLERSDFLDARGNFEKALTLDNRFARAHAYLAWWHNFAIGEGISADPSVDREAALRHASLAVEHDAADVFALAVQGHITSFLRGDTNAGIALFDRALAIDDSSAFAWGLSASTLCFRGQYEEALQRIQSALRLSPFDPMYFFFSAVVSIAEFGAGRLENAVSAAQSALQVHPRFVPARRIQCAALAILGDLRGARVAADALLLIDPDFRVETFSAWYPLVEPARASLRDGLLASGLPA